jgi:hypothetical protein
MISDTAPTNVVLPAPNPPEMTIFVADERLREDPVTDERLREDPVTEVSLLAVPPVEPGGPSECP